MKKVLFGILFFVHTVFTFAANNSSEKPDEIKYLFSFDSTFTMAALKNNGIGFGLNYERKLTNFLSIKPGFGQMTYFENVTTLMAITIDLQLSVYYYPLSNGLDKLYIGLGSGYGFVTYNKKMPTDFYASINPVIGWKWKIVPFLMVEPFIGWKFLMHGSNSYEDIEKYLNGGLQGGIGIKLFIKDIIK